MRALACACITAGAIAATACGNSVDYFSGGFGGTGGGFFDSGTTQTDPEKQSACDFAAEDERCTFLPDYCELGDHPNPSCNALLECSGSRWVKVEANQCAEGCPAAFDSVVPDSACAVPLANTLRCEYFEGTCGCVQVARREQDAGKDDGGDAGDADQPVKDAGETDAGTPEAGPYEWRCIKRTEGCPRIRPRLGTSCVKPLRCDYGECLFDDGIVVRCTQQFWTQDESFACGP